MTPVYLDFAATTPVDSRVAELVLRLMTQEYGNAGSRTHATGAAALKHVNKAREQIATALGSTSDEIIFTSGATEANNLALLGLEAFGRRVKRMHVVSTAIEHKAVLEPLQRLEVRGFELSLVPPDSNGRVDAQALLEAVRPDTLLVSVMHANNETGAVQPIGALADGLEGKDAYLHVDAAQSFGRETPALRHRRIDLISLSGHKLYAPKGVGALCVRRRDRQRVPLEPLMVGGGQERGLRPGTLPVPLIAGFGLASELAHKEQESRRARCAAIRSEALHALAPLAPVVHGTDGAVLPHILSFAVRGVDSEAIMVAANDLVEISNGSACTSSEYAPSHVLVAMGLDEDVIAGTVRVSWSHDVGDVPWELFAQRIADLRL
ncbi:cysteine desulfurase family protein [Sphingobium lignivorans]|uniref:Cysteine desulfurase n=1 Tax=Sphingobium lignivorans TaxID=2735886 RepID=A0ABR6NKQ2_9SPHN|nr:aminotransferase class V-fold PLP-dependent enzyme [Sphingobium lignivorans]MBB5987865.1 cysteine desulfurase [Sphingobium lignivorans]